MKSKHKSILEEIEEKVWEHEDKGMSSVIKPYAIICDVLTFAKICQAMEDDNLTTRYIYIGNYQLKVLPEYRQNGLINFEILYTIK